MKITYMAAGAGAMYCGACIRDLALVAGLRERGHEVDLIALYTPLKGDTERVAETASVYYGGINVFLQQASALFRHTPERFDRLLDASSLLGVAARFGVSTAPEKLGPVTVSVLAGEDGRQRKELVRLVDRFRRVGRPDVANITNSLLSGIAPALKAATGTPIVCNVQGEDSFLERIPEPHYSECVRLMRKNAESVDLFLAPSDMHARKMAEWLGTPSGKMKVVPAGVDAKPFARSRARRRVPFTVGYLSVINPPKGLDVLVDAFGILVNERARDARLHVAGRVLDKRFWKTVVAKLSSLGLGSRAEFEGELGLEGKVEFLHNVSAFCVPSRIEESRGMAVMEAMAVGLPVVAPRSGIFPELIASRKNGLMFEPGNAGDVADKLARLMDRPDEADAIGVSAARRISRHNSLEQMVAGVEAAYEDAMSG